MLDVQLDRFHPLSSGARVRLRLARSLDRQGLAALLTDLGLTADELDVRRLLRCEPGRCWAIVATRWDGMVDQLVGFGSLEASSGRVTLLSGDPEITALVDTALHQRADAHSRRVA